jgi:hypothetical protein
LVIPEVHGQERRYPASLRRECRFLVPVGPPLKDFPTPPGPFSHLGNLPRSLFGDSIVGTSSFFCTSLLLLRHTMTPLISLFVGLAIFVSPAIQGANPTSQLGNAQGIEWTACQGISLDTDKNGAGLCANLSVPRDYSNPESNTISLRLAEVPSKNGPPKI